MGNVASAVSMAGVHGGDAGLAGAGVGRLHWLWPAHLIVWTRTLSADCDARRLPVPIRPIRDVCDLLHLPAEFGLT